MTSHVARLYALSGAILAFFLAWAGIAAHPWTKQASATASPTRSLAAYEQRLRRDAVLVGRLSTQPAAAAPTPSVRIVTLPPLTTTRTS
jgi:hypothetical protein